MKLPNKAYDILKFLCTILIPAISSLYFGLSKIWGFPYGEEITGTLALVATFIGALIGISSVSYYAENNSDENGE